LRNYTNSIFLGQYPVTLLRKSQKSYCFLRMLSPGERHFSRGSTGCKAQTTWSAKLALAIQVRANVAFAHVLAFVRRLRRAAAGGLWRAGAGCSHANAETL